MDRQGLRKFIAPVQQRVTVADLLADIEADLQLRGLKSARKVLYHAQPIREHFGAVRALDITAAMVDKYIAMRRAAGKSNAYINRGVQVLDAAGKLAVRNGKLTSWPNLRKLAEAGNAKQGFFEASEFEKVIGHLPEYLQDAARFAYACGWRKSEVAGLRWEWVDRAAGQIVLPDSKNGRGRLLAIAGDLVELLRRRETARLVETPMADSKWRIWSSIGRDRRSATSSEHGTPRWSRPGSAIRKSGRTGALARCTTKPSTTLGGRLRGTSCGLASGKGSP